MSKWVSGFADIIPRALLAGVISILLAGIGLCEERSFPSRLPGTGSFQLPEDIFERLHQQMDDYFLRRIKATPSLRDELWKPDFTSADHYGRSIEEHRRSLRRMLGLRRFQPEARKYVLRRSPVTVEELEIRLDRDYVARALLFLPPVPAETFPAVIALGPANQMREEFVGILEEQNPAPWISELLGRGVAVAVPALVRRSYDHPWSELSWEESMDRRRFLYRLAFVVGRTMPGLEVQQVLSLRRELSRDERLDSDTISVMGIEQGGMTALYAAAVDPEISGAVVADYFDQRENAWQEPVDRTLWRQLKEFGDAEIAALVAPRPLSILTRRNGKISQASVEVEGDRARRYYRGLDKLARFQSRSFDSPKDAAEEVVRILGKTARSNSVEFPVFTREEASRVDQLQFDELHRYLRSEIEQSRRIRTEYWGLSKVSDEKQRDLVADLKRELRNLMGVVSNEGFPLNPRTALIEVNESFAAYDVILDVAPGLEAWGHLLIPRKLTGRAPAVIAQHGGGGKPAMVTGVGYEEDSAYHAFGRRLAQRGYVVFAPMIAVANLPFPEADSRLESIRLGLAQAITPKVRMAATLGMMRTSIEQARLGRIVNFLQTLDFVAGDRIGYYGLSYGGYSAIWMTALEPRIRATVISGHFNDWEPKITSHRIATSYLRHPDEDFTNWNVLHRFSHLELIAAMWPASVCIEYGERDAVTPPGWFRRAWRGVREYASDWEIEDQVELVYFDGSHEIHGVQTFDFLDRWLRPGEVAGRDYVEDLYPPPSSETEVESVRITRHLDSSSGARLLGSFYMSEDAPVLNGLKFRISRNGDPGDLILRIGSGKNQDDIATSRVPSGQVPASTDSWIDVPVGPVRLDPTATYHYELTAEWGWTDAGDDYTLYGPKPLGGSCPVEHFGISYRVLATGD